MEKSAIDQPFIMDGLRTGTSLSIGKLFLHSSIDLYPLQEPFHE